MNDNYKNILVSIITVVRNNSDTIEHCIKSVLAQNFPNIEYIIIDGNSTDGTLEIIKKFRSKIYRVISENDKGIYDAFNKGIKIANGDIIGMLNSDDFFYDDNVIQEIVEKFRTLNFDILYGNMEIVYKNDLNKIYRYWAGGRFLPFKLKLGWMPPHPSCYINKDVYSKYGLYDDKYKISGDYDFLIRIFKVKNLSISYLNKTLIKMRHGGKSNKNIYLFILKKYEDYKALKKNKILFPLNALFWKSFIKIPQLFIRH